MADQTKKTALSPPQVKDGVLEGDIAVEVWDTIPGARVELYVMRDNGAPVLTGSSIVDERFRSVVLYCDRLLLAGDQVSARQMLFMEESEQGQPVIVRCRSLSLQRPFYIIGHNPNTIAEVSQALQAGANGIEPDINVYSDNSDKLCVSHFKGGSDTVSLEEYLINLHSIAREDSRLSLVIFDCKSAVATAKFGISILTAIRNYLTYDTVLNIIISVSDPGAGNLFDGIIDILGPREGLMIDENNDPKRVSDYFLDRKVNNSCYANGISVPLPVITGPNVRPSIEKACALRAETGMPRFIGVWTINNESLRGEYIRIGVDGIISDDLKELSKLITGGEFKSSVRLAVREDNPFRPANNNYCLAVYTADSAMAGTDANLTFILNGMKGSSQVTVNSAFRSRMERNQLNYITLASPDLGNLISLTVQRDNQGNAPNWFLDRIVVTSTFFTGSKVALFNREIECTVPFTQNF